MQMQLGNLRVQARTAAFKSQKPALINSFFGSHHGSSFAFAPVASPSSGSRTAHRSVVTMAAKG
jgi:hypothetical protein